MKTTSPPDKFHDDAPASLNPLKDQNPFVTPEGYFETLPSLITNRIKTESQKLPEKRNTRRMFGSVAAIAAALAACLFLFYLLIPEQDHPSVKHVSQEANTEAALLEYLQNEDEIDQDMVISLLDEAPQPLVFGQSTLAGFMPEDSITDPEKVVTPVISDTTISADDILQYLLDEGFEIDPNS